MNVDLQEIDFGSVVRRRANQGPPDKGGYNMFCTLVDRSLPNIHPFGHLAIRADGKEPINGWASSPKIEELRTAWLATADPGEQKRLCIELQKQLWGDVPFIPLHFSVIPVLGLRRVRGIPREGNGPVTGNIFQWDGR